jgi:hypothetical protein
MFMRRAAILLFASTMAFDCGSEGGNDPTGPDVSTFDAPWPANMSAVLTTSFSDPSGDQIALPPEMDAPPYSGPVDFPPVDITGISVGVDGDFLYMRVDYAGIIPSHVIVIPPDGEVEEQSVGNQGMNIALNVDGDAQTGGGGEGVDGIDIFFAVGFDYGISHNVYVNWDFPDGDVHHNQHHAEGELGEGGPGYDYALVRYDISDLGSFFPRGQTVDIGSWSEAESFNADGSLKYHHFAFDLAIDGGSWTIPTP